ncbi:hypothetical protein OVA07_11550 [Novosphingobium sp. SL115]|uniref:hypothetical protein n=1 Tax=Novosphingobium sp. SL115 TaxID=2995150 RepID=UPI0022746D8E|nr:hypothetical protein [Novosphingobium sp. SL115]MCY1671642.1 hypothetical protein [Novosphingobium sp. SL115]
MNGGTRIIPIESTEPDVSFGADLAQDAHIAQACAEASADEAFAGWHADDSPSSSDRSWIAPSLTLACVAIWTGVFVWTIVMPGGATGATAPQWIDWIAQWSVPVLLALVLLLVIMRTSKREAARFGDVSLALANEAARLEKRLTGLNTELSLAREFIAAQSRDLESLGRVATERLSGSATRLEELVTQNGMRIDLIAQVSTNALDNMDKLRSQLPVIAHAAKDVTNNIGNAGRSAHLQLEELVSGFQRLNEFGLASERQVISFRERVDTALAGFSRASEDLAQLAEGRFETLRARSNEQAHAAAQAETAALEAWRARTDSHAQTLQTALQQLSTAHETVISEAAQRLGSFEHSARSLTSALHDQSSDLADHLARRHASAEATAAEQGAALDNRLAQIDEAIARRRAAMEQAAAASAEALAAKLADFDQAIDAQRKSQLAEVERLAMQCAKIEKQINALSDVIRNSGEQGGHTAEIVDSAIVRLNTRLGEMRHALSGTDLEIGELTDSAVRLLELVQAGADHTRTQMPEALRSTEAGLKGLEDRVFTLRDTLREAGDGGRVLAQTVGSARNEVAATLAELHTAQEGLTRQSDERQQQIAALQKTLEEARQTSTALSQDIEDRLAGALANLANAAATAGDTLRASTADQIDALAAQLGEQSSAAISRVLQGRAAELVGRLEEAIDSAALASRDTAIAMRDQLTKVDELAGNLEARVSRARERAEEQVDNDFARRAALITESLNSSAIDIAKALSTDVSETAWASYLRGDRGIFTRRAVTLLESAEAKSVQGHYESDSEFREHVNRYIHDFESMLRQLLATRDGNALGVTLLSSDMGKLYVALAQGIERLRT